ncbi:MAG: hypothetical protein LBN34_06355 [Clostridiales Family XIII bacterium]|jgi:hypothetical protein|nr:hypothetical protein [Clostridiales Family XIII bacterium]
MSKTKKITGAEFDWMFDEGVPLDAYLDLSTRTYPNRESKRVNVDMPKWMVAALDDAADRLGVARQAVIKTWLDEKIRSIS